MCIQASNRLFASTQSEFLSPVHAVFQCCAQTTGLLSGNILRRPCLALEYLHCNLLSAGCWLRLWFPKRQYQACCIIALFHFQELYSSQSINYPQASSSLLFWGLKQLLFLPEELFPRTLST